MTFAYRVVPVTNFMVSIPGIITGVTLSLADFTFAYRRCTCYLFYGEFNTWYYCWRDSVSCRWHLLTAVEPVTYFMVSIPGIIAGVTLSLADGICLPPLNLLLILWCQYLVLLLA